MNSAAAITPACKVHVVDDDDNFRTGLTRVLNASGLKAVGYRCASEFLSSDASTSPGCVLLDVCMPGPSGIEILDALAAHECAPPVIFVTGCSDVSTTVHAIKSGALGFITKPVDTQELLKSVQHALDVDKERRTARHEKRVLRARFSRLTPREQEVFSGVVRGLLNKQLATELRTCERTVKTHRAQMMRKLGVNSLAALVRIAKALEGEAPPRERSSLPI